MTSASTSTTRASSSTAPRGCAPSRATRLPPGEFEKLQDEVHSGIKDDVRGEHADGYRRVVAVVKTARALPLTSNPLTTPHPHP